jgi:hypothetical protein
VLAERGYQEGTEWLIGFADDDTGEDNRMFAIETLGRACQVNFFSDKARWREWWKVNKHRLARAAAEPK